VNGVAKSVRVIGKGNRERLVPLPEAFGQVFGFWLNDKGKEDFVFAKQPGGKAPSPWTVRAYLRRLLARAGIDKKERPISCGARGHPGIARACEPGDHTDLHACERG
jgi:integrase/recombinase XerD